MQLYLRIPPEEKILIDNLLKLEKAVKENGRRAFVNKNDMLVELLALGILKYRETHEIK